MSQYELMFDLKIFYNNLFELSHFDAILDKWFGVHMYSEVNLPHNV